MVAWRLSPEYVGVFFVVVCVVCSCLVFGFGFFPECDVSFMVAESTLSLNRSATVVRRSTFFRKANAAATKSAVYQVKTIIKKPVKPSKLPVKPIETQ